MMVVWFDSINRANLPDCSLLICWFKMKVIMKRHNLKKYQVSEILGISKAAVVGWFKLGTNVRGIIKPIYFDLLKIKGYK